MKKASLFIILLLSISNCYAQKQVSITIDDTPNTEAFYQNKCESQLLNKLDSLSIPTAIFINENRIYKDGNVVNNFELFDKWIKNELITIGNHTSAHSRYSSAGIDSFKQDILKGEYVTRELSILYNKPLKYFRFPYNDLGKDSLQRKEINDFLFDKGYIVTPFTIESVDWMYNNVYVYYLKNEQREKAKEIGIQYVNKTIEFFDFFNNYSNHTYNRPIKQIFLCHDNLINAHYIDLLIQQLSEKGYEFISLDEALSDKIYKQENLYYKKWGISWFYRWMRTQKERVEWMKKEPSTKEIETIYNNIKSIEKGY